MKIGSNVLAMLLASGLCTFPLACKTTGEEGGSRPIASAASATVPSAPPVPQPPPYVGEFQGTYDAKLFRIEMTAAEGAVKEWEEDDGAALRGQGSLVLNITEDRKVTGTSQGPLGELRASGILDGELLRVSLVPVTPRAPNEAVSATFLGTLVGEGVKGTLRASSGDSLKARTAEVTLARNSKPAAAPSRIGKPSAQ